LTAVLAFEPSLDNRKALIIKPLEKVTIDVKREDQLNEHHHPDDLHNCEVNKYTIKANMERATDYTSFHMVGNISRRAYYSQSFSHHLLLDFAWILLLSNRDNRHSIFLI
jgi:hypothetical protein